MQAYIGAKVILAEPMTEDDFLSEYKGVESKEDTDIECVSNDGFHVRYSNPNGSYYDSWSPSDVFLRAYRPIAEDEKSLMK
ncbi:MAG: hypothetical protein OQK82_05415 [Candidatus Pacearchaeota archaeon]|nr:hypothetical protein [Candidatus Pacearchaeota archaeon]